MTACPKCGFDAAATVLASYSFLVERDPPSLNKRIVNTLIAGRTYRQERALWQYEFRAKRLALNIPYAHRDADDRSSWPVEEGRRRVTLTRRFTGRQKRRDVDNLTGGMKAVVDALVRERLLFDDAPEHAELHYDQHRIESGPGLHVQIEILADRNDPHGATRA